MNPPNIEGNIDISKKKFRLCYICKYSIWNRRSCCCLSLWKLLRFIGILSRAKIQKQNKFFTSETIIAQPIKKRFSILEKRNSVLSKVSKYINEYLDPSKKVLLNMYLANCRSWRKTTIGLFQSQQILTIRFIFKEEPIPVLLIITIQCC